MKPPAVLTFAVCLLFPLCTQLDNTVVPVSTSTVVPGKQMLAGLDPYMDLNNLTITVDSVIYVGNVSEKEVDRVFLRSMTISVISPEGEDLSFARDAQIFLKGRNGSKTRVAWGGPFAPGTTTAKLSCSSIDLTKYLVADSVTFIGRFSGRAPEENVTLLASLELMVDANVAGIMCGSRQARSGSDTGRDARRQVIFP